MPITTHLLYENGEYKVSSFGIIEGKEVSIFINLDENFDAISTKTYFDVFVEGLYLDYIMIDIMLKMQTKPQ